MKYILLLIFIIYAKKLFKNNLFYKYRHLKWRKKFVVKKLQNYYKKLLNHLKIKVLNKIKYKTIRFNNNNKHFSKKFRNLMVWFIKSGYLLNEIIKNDKDKFIKFFGKINYFNTILFFKYEINMYDNYINKLQNDFIFIKKYLKNKKINKAKKYHNKIIKFEEPKFDLNKYKMDLNKDIDTDNENQKLKENNDISKLNNQKNQDEEVKNKSNKEMLNSFFENYLNINRNKTLVYINKYINYK